MTAIIYLAVLPTIKSRIRLIKVVETVPLTVTLLMLLTINLKQKATKVVKIIRVISTP